MRKNVKVHAENPNGSHSHAKNVRKKSGARKPTKRNSKEKKKTKRTSRSNTGNDGDPTIHHGGEKKLKNKRSSHGLLVTDKNSSNRDNLNPSLDTNSAEIPSPTNQNQVVTENDKPAVPGLDNKLEKNSEKVSNKAEAQQAQGVQKQTTPPPPAKEIKRVPQSPPSSGSSHESCKSNAPGLDSLEGTSGFYVFKRSDPLEFIVGSILVSSYNVMNEKGETIFYIGETQEKCILCASWSHRLPIYSVQEQLVMSLLRRNPSCCNRSAELQMARFIDADLVVHAEESFVYPPKAAYHITLPSGEFLGHIKVFETELFDAGQPFKYIVIDEKYQELYKIRDVQRTDPERAADTSVSNHFFDEATDARYDIYYEHRKLGNIHSRANLRKFGIEIESGNCFQATYPFTLTNVQKALILGLMAVTKCQTISSDDQVCEACCTLFCKTKCAII